MRLLYSASEWLIALVFMTSLILVSEGGFWAGRRIRSGVDDTARSQIVSIQGAMLALFGLLLAFTVSMAVSRYDIRKQLVVAESNAIGTTYLRAQLLAEPHRTEVARLLREYVDVRLEFYDAGADLAGVSRANDAAATLQRELWSHAIAVGRMDARAVTTGLFIESLNDVIDLPAKRLAALENRIPEVVMAILFVGALLAVGVVGVGFGLGDQRNVLLMLAFAILVTLVVVAVIDLDRPRRGLIKVSQQAMLQLRDSLDSADSDGGPQSSAPRPGPSHLAGSCRPARDCERSAPTGQWKKKECLGVCQGGLARLSDTTFIDA